MERGQSQGYPLGMPGNENRETLREKDFRSRVRREFRDLRDSMLTDEQRARLRGLWVPARWILGAFWLLKGLLIYLTPTRRILLLIGLVLAQTQLSFHGDRVNVTGGFISTGIIIILFVLMLELKDKLLAKNELKDGHAVQRALMPERSPVVQGWRLWLFTRPANDVGGDLIDFVRLGGGKTALTIGDVAGKGLKAALLTAKLQATLRAFVSESPSLVDLVSRVNAVFRRDSLPQVFASIVCMRVEPGTGTVRIVNAGHPSPLLIRHEALEQMSKGGPALGLMDSAQFSEQVVELSPGETVLVYSDGVIETRNAAGEFFGEDRLRALIQGSYGSSAAELGERLIATCDRFQGDAPAHDDLSVVILQRA